MTIEPRPFDPNDPFDSCANMFRQDVTHSFTSALAALPQFDALDARRQLECFLCGVLTGALGVAFAHVTPEGRDAVLEMLVNYLPEARRNVEDMLREGMH